MRKYLLFLFSLLAWNVISHAADGTVLVIDKIAPKNGAFVGVVDSSQTLTNVTNFNNNLSASDNTVQKALDTLDNMTISGGGGGSSTLAVGTGTASNFTTNVTSPTAVISFLGTQFGSVANGTTNFMTIKNSGVTAGTYGSATQVSSVTVGADGRVTGAANVTISLTNSNLQAGTYSNVTVPAANVAAGSLGASVIASSIAVNAVQDASIVGVSGTKITGTATIPNAAINGSSITKAGVLVAGSGITLTPGSGSTTISSAGGSPAGSNTNVQYNNSGSFGADSGFQYDSSVSSVTIGGALKVNGIASILSSGTNPLIVASQTSGFGSGSTIGFYTNSTTLAGTLGYDSTNNYYGWKDSSGVRMSGARRGFFPNRSSFQIYNISGSNYVAFRSSDTTTSQDYVLPQAQGSAGQVLSINAVQAASGGNEELINLEWITPSGGGGSGSSIYPASSTAFFPSGLHVSTISITDSQGGANKARVFYNDFGAGGSEIHLNMDTGSGSPAEQLVIGSTNTSNKNIVFNGSNTGILGFSDSSEILNWNKKLDVDQTLNVDGNVTFGSGPGFEFDSSVSSATLDGAFESYSVRASSITRGADYTSNFSQPWLKSSENSFGDFADININDSFNSNGYRLFNIYQFGAYRGSFGYKSSNPSGFYTMNSASSQTSSWGLDGSFSGTDLAFSGIFSSPLPKTITSSQNLSTGTFHTRADATGGAIVITLPKINVISTPQIYRYVYSVCKIDATANSVSFAASSGDSLDASVPTMVDEYECVILISSNTSFSSDGGRWFSMMHSNPNSSGGGGGGGGSSLEVFNNFNGARSSPTASIGMSNAFAGSVTGSTFTFALNSSSVTLYGPNIPAASISAGSLGASVIASSIAVNAVQDASIVGVSGSKITGTGTIPNAAISGSSVTKQGVITAGSGISVTNGSGIVTIAATGSGITGTTTTISMTIDGQGSAIVAGSTRSITVPFQCVISSWSVVADASGSLAVHLASSTFNNYPTITNITGAGNGPSLSSQSKRGAAVSGWTQTTIDAGSVLAFVVDSASTVKWATIVLWVIR